jgi:hypothetical protein
MRSTYPLLIALLLCLPLAAAAGEGKAKAPTVFGWLEKGIVMPVGATVKIKLDSGALTSSMDAKNILTYKRKDKNWVSFRLHLEDKETGTEVLRDLEMPVKRFVRVRGAGGEERRVAVVLPICIGDRVFKEEFTLRDRDNMLYPVLLGRRTLKRLGLLDVTATYLVPPTCEVRVDPEDVIEVDRE